MAVDAKTSKSIAALALGLLGLSSLAQIQAPLGEVRIRGWAYQLPEVRVQTNEVQVGVVVRNAKGHVVSGLKQGDFKIYDNGKEQMISAFSIETRQLHAPSGTTAKATAPAAAQPNLAGSLPPRPRYVALYFDDLNTEFGDMRHVQVAAENFVQKGVGPQDKIALFTASGLQTVGFTTNTQGILDAIENLRFHGRAIKSTGCPLITPYDAYEISAEPLPPVGAATPMMSSSTTYGTILAEAVQCNCINEGNVGGSCAEQQEVVIRNEAQQIWASVHEMAQDTLETIQSSMANLTQQSGERVLVLASSGFLTGTLEIEVDEMVENALRAGVVINSLDAKGLYTLVGVMDPNHGYTDDASNGVVEHSLENFGPAMSSAMGAMVDFAVGTGGRYFHNRNDLTAGYYSLAVAPQTEYLLGFTPENEKRNGHFHKLKVEVTAPGKFGVQARPGYFAPQKETEEASEATPEEKIDAEVRGTNERSDFPVRIDGQLRAGANGIQELHVGTHVDVKKLPFGREQNRHVETLTFVAALFDTHGNMVAGKEAQMQLALKPDTFARFSKSGIDGAMSLEAPPGTYRLRVVVEEALRGEMTAASRNVQIQ
jgi:VWFA-related protein